MRANPLPAIAVGVLCFAGALAIGYASFSYRTRPLLHRSFTATTHGLPQPPITKPDQSARPVQHILSQPVPILMYHYVRSVSQADDPLGYDLSVTPALFAEQLDALRRAGYQTITPTQLALGDVPTQPILLSFDDGYRDFYDAAYPALIERGMTAVVFVITGSLDDRDGRYLTRAQVQELAASGIAIGSHTVSHLNLVAADTRRRQDELLISRQVLEQLTGQRVIAVAYPAGETNNEVVELADYVGYSLGVTTHHGAVLPASPRLLLPRIRVRGGDSPEALLTAIERARTATEPAAGSDTVSDPH